MDTYVLNLVRTIHGGRGAAQSRAAARLMSLLEDQPNRLPELLQTPEFQPRPPRLILGLTGAPGAGKSSLADALIAAYRALHPERRIGVIAVDPTSPFTGGAVLGDRVRMMRHATDPLVFVRSMATRGHLGGLTLGVRGVIRVMELLGCELILLETVGVGQSEVEVAAVADRTLIVFAPGQGDSIQLLKAGLMEIGDLFVVNKADRPGAAELYSQMLAVLKLSVVNEGGGSVQLGGHWGLPGAPAEGVDRESSPDLSLMRSRGMPEVFLVSALERTGMDKLVASLELQADAGREAFLARRESSLREEVRQAILEEARRRVEETLGSNGTVGEQVARVMDGRASVAELAGELLRKAGQSMRKD
jgi:LAO/AO transport system kinase